MIKIEPKREFSDFDEKVRQPGLAFLDQHGISEGMEVPKNFKWENFWKNALEDLADDYGGICAYSCIYLEYAAGGLTVDHFFPKKKYPRLAFEWSNYRLAATRFNSRKGDHEDVLDPFGIENGWFHIDFPSGKVFPSKGLDDGLQALVEDTIKRLSLNEPRLKRIRTKRFDAFLQQKIGLEILKEYAPHIHQEILRQNLHQ